MFFTEVKNKIFSLDHFTDSPEIHSIFDRVVETDALTSPDYVFLACEAVGGNNEEAIPAAAANLSSLISIHLIDDMLDNDPNGLYHKLGVGTIANLSQALTGAAFALLHDYEKNADVYPHLVQSVAKMITDTCFAQQADLVPALNENEYWKKISSKTPPLFSSALFCGSLIGCRNAETAMEISKLGVPFGQLIQISDDLSDAFQNKITPDWQVKTNNLAILYAMTADHRDKEEFNELLDQLDNINTLKKLQSILFRSGSVSYCIYHLIELNKQAHYIIEQLDIPKKECLHTIRKALITPTEKMMNSANLYGDNKFIREVLSV